MRSSGSELAHGERNYCESFGLNDFTFFTGALDCNLLDGPKPFMVTLSVGGYYLYTVFMTHQLLIHSATYLPSQASCYALVTSPVK